MFFGYPITDWYSFIEALEGLAVIFTIVYIFHLHEPEEVKINRNRFIK